MIDCVTITFDWVAVGSIASVLVALVTYGTILEIKKQREQSYMPELIIDNGKKFNLYTTEDIQFMYWHENKVKEIKEITTTFVYDFTLDCFNIGRGTAKYINVRYEIDFNKMKSAIENTGRVSIDKIGIDENNNTSFNGKFGDTRPLGFGSINDLHLEYIFIHDRNEDAFKISLPKIYLSLFDAFILSEVYSGNEHWMENISKFPAIKLKMSYKDIANKVYPKEFTISFKVHSAAITTGEPSFISGIINIQAKR